MGAADTLAYFSVYDISGSGRPDIWILAFLISATANTLVYGVVGSVVSFCYRRFFFRPA